jgi:hypothetical protein
MFTILATMIKLIASWLQSSGFGQIKCVYKFNHSISYIFSLTHTDIERFYLLFRVQRV